MSKLRDPQLRALILLEGKKVSPERRFGFYRWILRIHSM
jgi:hypothetical protein